MGLIYMKISPSGGKYIGQTIQTESKRWIQHVHEASDLSNRNANTILNNAIRKYGANNFQTIILEDNLSQDQLNEREQYWIKYYNTFYLDNSSGYNMTRGGNVIIEKGVHGNPILQYDTGGNFIKEWSSACRAAEFYKNHVNNLYLALEHDTKISYCGFLWKRKDDPIDIKELITLYNNKQAARSYLSKQIYCYENDTTYASCSQASTALGISRKLISKYAKLDKPEPKSGFHFKLV